VPLGSLGMSAFLLDAAWSLSGSGTFATVRLAFDLFAFAAAGGLLIVPLYTLLQERSSSAARSRVIAANNVVNAGFMVAGALLLSALFAAGVSQAWILAICALANLCVAAYIYSVVPEFLLRLVCFCLARLLYRVRIEGQDHVPQSGPAVLVCNHVSFVDWLVIAAATPRPIRFVMHHSFVKPPFTRVLNDAKVIPIAGAKEDPQLLEAAFTRIAEELSQGELVCIFPEGKLTLDGEIAPFRRGIERILGANPVPVVPMHLGGLWQSFFSRYARRRPFRALRSRVRLTIGAALSPEHATASVLEARVRELGRDSEEALGRHTESVAAGYEPG